MGQQPRRAPEIYAARRRWINIVSRMQQIDWSRVAYTNRVRRLVREYGEAGEAMFALGLESEAAQIANEIEK